MTSERHSAEPRGDSPPVAVFGLAGQFLLIPLEVLVYALQLTLVAMQDTLAQAREAQRRLEPPSPQPPTIFQEVSPRMSHESDVRQDRELQDNMLKLVRYRILFIKREYEHAFHEGQELVYDNMDGTAFAGWKIADFIQSLKENKVKLPAAWKDKHYPGGEYVRGDHLTGIPSEDKKYLRVYYEVQERYPREKFRYEEIQVDVLRDIAQSLREKNA